MKPVTYPCPLSGGGEAEELALTFDQGRAVRLLIVPALFDEANRMRRFTVEVMRRLDGAGIDCFLPDLPGCNESLQDLALLEPEDWATAMHAAARYFGANRVLAIRGGGLILPPQLGGWHYAPVQGASLLKTMLRARIIASREAGREETTDSLVSQGLDLGLDLAGYSLSAEMIRQLLSLFPAARTGISAIDQDTIGGSPLWLRAEPDEDSAQADALAALIAMSVSA
ncbi:MAG: hypothetical protein KGM49_15395 [Sphingomonadales bacterium]|nr:hypothetical protein [Sphingomonadales bacterium]